MRFYILTFKTLNSLQLCTVLWLFLQVFLVCLYLLLCVLYWAWSAVQLAAELRDVLDVKHFINNKLGISDRQVRTHCQRPPQQVVCFHVHRG
jgi:hypothetical protein